MQAAVMLALVALPWARCTSDRDGDLDRGAEKAPLHREVATERVEPKAPVAVKRISLPEAVVVRALDAMRPAVIRCFERAKKLDPLMARQKITLHLEIDTDGAITALSTNSDRPRLANCLAGVGRAMTFPPPRQPAMVDVPLMF